MRKKPGRVTVTVSFNKAEEKLLDDAVTALGIKLTDRDTTGRSGAIKAALRALPFDEKLGVLDPAERDLVLQRRKIRDVHGNRLLDEVLTAFGGEFGADQTVGDFLFDLLDHLCRREGRVVSRTPSGRVSVAPAPEDRDQDHGAAALRVAEKSRKYRS